MTEYSLLAYLYNHLELLGLPSDLEIELGGFSNSYLGRYNTQTQTITLYHLEQDGSLIDLDYLLSILRHEAIHHFQWKHDKTFFRVKGIMHNKEFHRLEKIYNYKYQLLKGERIHEIH